MLTSERYVKPKKWDKLAVELEEFVKKFLDSKGNLTKSLNEIFSEFAKKHNTTKSSTAFYYYNSGMKDKIYNEINSNTKTDIRKNNSNDELNNEKFVEAIEVDNEIEKLIEYFENNYDIKITNESIEMIKDMVDKTGIVSTFLKINDVIKDYEKLDISFVLIREAMSRI